VLFRSIQDAVVIGDSVYDIEMARNARVASIAVTTGIHTKELLAKSSPTYIVASLENILNIILK